MYETAGSSRYYPARDYVRAAGKAVISHQWVFRRESVMFLWARVRAIASASNTCNSCKFGHFASICAESQPVPPPKSPIRLPRLFGRCSARKAEPASILSALNSPAPCHQPFASWRWAACVCQSAAAGAKYRGLYTAKSFAMGF